MIKKSVLIAITLLCVACGAKKPTLLTASTNRYISAEQVEPFLDVTELAEDKTYGLSEDNPVKVGERSPSNQRRYLASLAGPNGETIRFYRQGSCCAYKSKNGLVGTALVDVYMVTYDGLEEPIPVYISFYDFEELKIPHGFTRRLL